MTYKTVYIFDTITGAYDHTYNAQESPLEPGVFLEPVCSTATSPPIVAANQVAIFANGAWSLQSDYRGQVIYDQASTASQEVTAIGPIPSGFALTTPPPTLAQAQATQIVLLTAVYANAVAQSVSYTSVAGVVKSYQANAVSVSNLIRMTLAFLKQGATPTGFYWVASDNTQVPFALADLEGLSSVIGAQGWAAFQHLQTQKNSVLAATTVSIVQSIVW